MTAEPIQIRPMTVSEYAALPEDHDGRYELQEGMRVMSPRPRPRHQDCLNVLWSQLSPQLPRGFKVHQGVDLDLELAPSDHPGTVRVPDLVVVAEGPSRRIDEKGGFLRASDALLVVEVFSPGSRRTDSRIKHDEYADAGIGHYWMIDLDDEPSLTACHLAGELGYVNEAPVRGAFRTRAPFELHLDLTALG